MNDQFEFTNYRIHILRNQKSLTKLVFQVVKFRIQHYNENFKSSFLYNDNSAELVQTMKKTSHLELIDGFLYNKQIRTLNRFFRKLCY